MFLDICGIQLSTLGIDVSLFGQQLVVAESNALGGRTAGNFALDDFVFLFGNFCHNYTYFSKIFGKRFCVIHK